ncbi:sensor histidine kinase [Georgenia faecalis]|uniref:sensor histidine kinase n=1 Tax=Georgenia faecalis TaxID=2483799 RepID=UPI000FDBEE09|nr:histidine kinase [Georgenia faecalis]
MTSLNMARRRTNPERFDLYTRGSLYVLLATAPLVGLSAIADLAEPAPILAYLGGLLTETVLAILVTSGTLRQFLGGPRVRPGWYVALGLTAAFVTAVAALSQPPADALGGRTGALALALALPLMVVAPVVRTRALVAGTLVVAALVAGSLGLPGPGDSGPAGGHPVPIAMTTAIVVGAMAATFRLSAWTLGVVWEQERMRTVHARLAVAEERLRFSRDLHDVVGRTFSAIAVKSELAAELARRGDDGALAQMLEVRELAQDSLKEVRGVVAGYREVDLAAELDGARSVLRAAGVSTRVLGEGASLPDPVQQALAWVVREAVTNVVRHAHPGTCTIDLAVVPGGPRPDGAKLGDVARLTVVNDGAHRTPVLSSGSGLLGLRERLAAVGGALDTAHDGGTFTLTATVPVIATATTARTEGRR